MKYYFFHLFVRALVRAADPHHFFLSLLVAGMGFWVATGWLVPRKEK